MKDKNKSYLFASFTILFWATSASAFKIGLKYIDYFQLLFIATLTTLIFLFSVLLFQKKLNIFKQLKFKDYRQSAFLGFLNPFLYYTVLFIAYSLLPAQVAQPLNFIWPITLVILSVPILKQKLKVKSIYALFISFIGVIIISSQGNLTSFHSTNPVGVLLALSSSIVWALFWVFNIQNKQDVVLQLFLNFLFALIFILIITSIFSTFKIVSLYGILAGIYIGLFEMGITFVLWLKALKLAGRTDKIGNLIYLTPFCSLIFIHLILGEKIFITTFFGLILIITGIFIQQKSNKHEKKNL